MLLADSHHSVSFCLRHDRLLVVACALVQLVVSRRAAGEVDIHPRLDGNHLTAEQEKISQARLGQVQSLYGAAAFTNYKEQG